MAVMLDLCCGLGGASRPAQDRGWTVIGMDLDRALGPAVCGDLRALPFRGPVDLLWISPPCITYSRWRMPWFGHPKPDTELMREAARIVYELKPCTWVIENVPASVPWCAEFLGPPTGACWSHVFWSNLFVLLPQVAPHKMKWGPYTPDRQAIRGLIPYNVALPFVRAAEEKIG